MENLVRNVRVALGRSMIARKESSGCFFLLPCVPDNPARSQRTRAGGTELPKTRRPSNRSKSLVTQDFPDRPESEAPETSLGAKENPETICFVAFDCRLDRARQGAGPPEQDQCRQDGPAQEAYPSLLFATGSSHRGGRGSLCLFRVDSWIPEHGLERARL